MCNNSFSDCQLVRKLRRLQAVTLETISNVQFGLDLVIPSSSTFTAANKVFCRQPRIAAAFILSLR